MKKRYYFDIVADESYVNANDEEEANNKIRELLLNGLSFEVYEVSEEDDE